MKKYDLLTSVILLILGIVLLFIPGSIITTVIRLFGILILILGVWIILRTIFRIQFVLNIRNKVNNYVAPLIINIITLIIGIILVFNPFKSAEALIRIIGLFVTIYSALDIINYYITKPKRLKVIK